VSLLLSTAGTLAKGNLPVRFVKASRSGSSPDSLELSEREILQSVRNILDRIEMRKKEWTGGRRQKYSAVKTKVLAGRLPADLMNEIHLFKGSNT
jgi:hypothetical protein